MGPVLAVVLAAGGSTRMGRPKQLAELAGRPLLAHVLAAAEDAPVDRGGVALGGAAAEGRDRRRLPPRGRAAAGDAPVDRVVVARGGAAAEVLDRVDLGRAEALVVE